MSIEKVAVLGAGNGGCATAAGSRHPWLRDPALFPFGKNPGAALAARRHRVGGARAGDLRTAPPHHAVAGRSRGRGGSRHHRRSRRGPRVHGTCPRAAPDRAPDRTPEPRADRWQPALRARAAAGGVPQSGAVLRDRDPHLHLPHGRAGAGGGLPAHGQPRVRGIPGGVGTGYPARDRYAVFPNIVPAENVLETGLSNINAIMHPAGMVGNAGWIEQHGGELLFYRQALSPAVARMIEGVDRERLAIVRALGLRPRTFVEIFHAAGLTSDARPRKRFGVPGHPGKRAQQDHRGAQDP